MNNYELRRKIAELEGWTDIQLGNERSLLDDANLELRGIPPVGAGPWDIRIIHYKIPDWLTDANAAMELVGKLESGDNIGSVSLRRWPTNNRWCAWLSDPFSVDIQLYGDGATFCEAICRLYVAWREAKEAKQ